MVKTKQITIGAERSAGLTLVEVAIAAGISALVLVLLIGAAAGITAANDITTTRSATVAEIATIADELNQATMEELLAYVPPTPSNIGLVRRIDVYYVVDGGATMVQTPIDFTAIPSTFTLPRPVTVRIVVQGVSPQGHPLTIESSTRVGAKI